MKLVTIVSSKKIEFIPIIYEFLKEVTEHIIIFDQACSDTHYAKELKVSLKKILKHYGLTSKITMLEIDEDSKKDMQHIATKIVATAPDIYLNGAGADIALFTVLSATILQNRGHVIAYDNEDNSYNLISQQGFTNSKIKRNMSIEDFLMLMGEEILEEVDQERIIDHQEALNQLFADTKQMFSLRVLLKQGKQEELKTRYPHLLNPLKQLGVVDDGYMLQGGDHSEFCVTR